MAIPSLGFPVARASEADRITFLRRTLAWSFAGVGIAGTTGVVTASVLALMPSLVSGYFPMLFILGMWAVTNFVARPMVFGAAKIPGFILGTAAQGVAMGFLLLVAAMVSAAAIGNPFALIVLAMGLTGFTALGMTAYVYTIKRDFSIIGAGLAALSIPMLILMAVSFAFPALFGGALGLLFGVVFVLISAAGLLYQLNQVVHSFNTNMHIEGGYTISIGILVLFWNILSLLMRLTRR